MTSTNALGPDLTSARARNESTWRASAVALYDGDIEKFLAYWSPEPRYAVAYPVDGFPPVVQGRDQFRASHPLHPALHDRVFDTDELGKSRLYHS